MYRWPMRDRVPNGITDTAMMQITLAERLRPRCRSDPFFGPDDDTFHGIPPLVLGEAHDRPHIPTRQGIFLREILKRRTASVLSYDLGVALLKLWRQATVVSRTKCVVCPLAGGALLGRLHRRASGPLVGISAWDASDLSVRHVAVGETTSDEGPSG
jgi:hypothetical protein